jgi:hypothetical protein
LVALRHTIKVLKDDFRRDGRAAEVARRKDQQLIVARIKALLDDDVTAGRLVVKSKNESDYVMLEDLMRWAEYRNVVIEQEAGATAIRRTNIRTEGVHQRVLEPS